MTNLYEMNSKGPDLGSSLCACSTFLFFSKILPKNDFPNWSRQLNNFIYLKLCVNQTFQSFRNPDELKILVTMAIQCIHKKVAAFRKYKQKEWHHRQKTQNEIKMPSRTDAKCIHFADIQYNAIVNKNGVRTIYSLHARSRFILGFFSLKICKHSLLLSNKVLQIYTPCVKQFGFYLGPHNFWALIWIQIVCKGH